MDGGQAGDKVQKANAGHEHLAVVKQTLDKSSLRGVKLSHLATQVIQVNPRADVR